MEMISPGPSPLHVAPLWLEGIKGTIFHLDAGSTSSLFRLRGWAVLSFQLLVCVCLACGLSPGP